MEKSLNSHGAAGLIESKRAMLGASLHTAEFVIALVIATLVSVIAAERSAHAAEAGSQRTATAPDASTADPTNVSPATVAASEDAGQPEQAARDSVAKPPIILRGNVYDPDRRPVDHARLFLSIDEWTDPIELGTSDRNGAYRFAVPENVLRRTVTGSFQHDRSKASLIAVAAGFGPGWMELSDELGGRYGEMKPEYANDIQLVPDLPIAGRIVDYKGNGVAGAVVSVDAIHELLPLWYKMPAAIEANDPNYMTREEADVNNWFTPLYPTAWRMIAPATTGADGRFKMEGVGDDRAIRLDVTGPGIRSVTVSVLTRPDADEFTHAIRAKYPRARRPYGYFYPERKNLPEGDQGVRLFGPTPTIEVDPARTIAGVVRDAATGEPIAGLQVGTADMYGAGRATTDRDGRYRLMRAEHNPSQLVYVDAADSDRYLTVVRRIDHAAGLGEIVADFEVPRGVIIEGRAVESGTDRAIVSAPRQGCHDIGPGPLIAGHVRYYPLASNTALRGSPTGLYYEGFPVNKINYYLSAAIDGDGRFRLVVPPGPGVVLLRAQAGSADQWYGIHDESAGLHRRFPYVSVTTRSQDDGAPGGSDRSFDGFIGPIELGSTYHAYQVIDPPRDATHLPLTIDVPRGPSLAVRFVDPDGRALRGVKVRGLAPPPHNIIVALDGPETEVLALEPDTPRPLIATSQDGKYVARTLVDAGKEHPKTIQLQPAASAWGRLVDADSGRPLANYSVTLSYPPKNRFDGEWIPWLGEEAKTEPDGRFLVGCILPEIEAAISFQEFVEPGTFRAALVHKPESVQQLVLTSGEIRHLGDIRVAPDANAAE